MTKIKLSDIDASGAANGSAVVTIDGVAQWATSGGAHTPLVAKTVMVQMIRSQQGSFLIVGFEFLDPEGNPLPAPVVTGNSTNPDYLFDGLTTTYYEGSSFTAVWAEEVSISAIRLTPTPDIYRDRMPLEFSITRIGDTVFSSDSRITITDTTLWTVSLPRTYNIGYTPSIAVVGVEDAPLDGETYGRKNGAWEIMPAMGSGEVEEAPQDGNKYIRVNGEWRAIVDPDSGGNFNGTRVGILANTAINENATVAWSVIRHEHGPKFFNPLAPTRLTIPAGVHMVELTAGLLFSTGSTNLGYVTSINKNGTPIARQRGMSENWAGIENQVSTGPIAVEEGDYFTVHHLCESGTQTLSAVDSTFFSIAVAKQHVAVTGDEAPFDGFAYVRKDGEWVRGAEAIGGDGGGGGSEGGGSGGGAAPDIPSWAKGSGERRFLVGVTATGGHTGNPRNSLGTAPVSSFYWSPNSAQKQLVFDFTNPIVVQGFGVIQGNDTANGTWTIAGSDDGGVYVDIITDFVWGGSPYSPSGQVAGNMYIREFDNTSPYRYYRVSSNLPLTTNNQYQSQFFFKSGTIGANDVGAITEPLWAFSGARIGLTDTKIETITGVATPILWDKVISDTDQFYDPATPSGFTIPAGVTKIRLTAAIAIDGSDTIGASNSFRMRRLGSTDYTGLGAGSITTGGYSSPALNLSSGVIDVTEGDVFQITYQAAESFALSPQSWFAIEAVARSGSWELDINDLADVQGTPSNGDVMAFDGTLGKWTPQSPAEVSDYRSPFKGAMVYRSTPLTSSTLPLFPAWNAVDYDTDGFWSVAAPERLTVPAGVTKVRLACFLAPESGFSDGQNIHLSIFKNGAMFRGGNAASAKMGYGDGMVMFTTPVLSVTAGDYFETRFNSSTGGSKTYGTTSYFSIEVVEYLA